MGENEFSFHLSNSESTCESNLWKSAEAIGENMKWAFPEYKDWENFFAL